MSKKRPYRRLDWTNKRVQRDLKKLSPTVFSHKYGVSYPQVIKRRKLGGLSKPAPARMKMPRGFKTAAEKLSVVALCAKYGVGRDAIHAWRAALGLHGHVARKLQDAKLVDPIRDYAARHLSGAEIARKLHVAATKVYRIARQNGIALNAVQTDMRIVRRDLMAALCASGLTYEQVGMIFNITRQRVQQLVPAKGRKP